MADEVDGKADRLPSSYISVEGGIAFDHSDENFVFDPGSDLGILGALTPGDDGWQGRIEYGRSINSAWDYKVGLGLIALGADEASDGIVF